MSQCAIWDCRCNRDFYANIDEFRSAWDGIAKHYATQLEKGETGYEHWQFRIALIKKKRKNELMKLISDAGHQVPNFLEPTSNGEAGKKMGDAFYQLKKDTRIEGPWTDRDTVKYVPRQFRNLKLYPWQETVVNDTSFDDRIVNCIIDTKGCNGKSTCARYAMLHHRAIKLPIHNDSIKLIQSTCNMLMARNERHPTHVFCDLPRALSKEKLGGLYIAIEEIKGGYVYDERNHFEEWWYDSPSVWVFSNEEPDSTLLSKDRWKLWEIGPELQLIPFGTLSAQAAQAAQAAHDAAVKTHADAAKLKSIADKRRFLCIDGKAVRHNSE